MGRSAIDSNVRRSWLLPLALVLACAACGDDSGDDDDDTPAGGSGAGEPCTQGTSWSCFGAGNCAGIQVCGPDLVFLPCRCSDTPGGGGRDGGGSGDAAVPPRDSGSEPEDAATRDAQTEPDATVPPAEDCDNDIDDDQDGDADCADDDCTARTCVEEAPTGWSGPVLLYEGDAAPPECSGGYPDEAARGGTAVTAAAASCSTCSCTPADPGCASFLNFETSTASACDDDDPCTVSINSSCAVLMSPCFTTPTGYVETHLSGTPPTCAPSAQDPTLPDADWDAQAIACAPDHALQRAGCDSGEVCAPEPAFDGAFCIVDDGDVPCPAGPYSDRRVYFTDIADTRDCSDCSCAHDCSYTWRVFDAADATCATPLLTLTQENQCASVTPSAGAIRVNVNIAGTGECAPSGGAPTGSAQGNTPITACCLPD